MYKPNFCFSLFAIFPLCFLICNRPASGADSAPAQTPKSGTSTALPQNVIRDANVAVKTNTREVDVEGEVVDTWCYTSGVMGAGRGEAHKSCARKCVGGGVTAGILADDGTLYIAAKHKAYNGCAGLLLPYVAMRVKVHGWLAEKAGVKLLKINTVEPVKVSGSQAKSSAKANTKNP